MAYETPCNATKTGDLLHRIAATNRRVIDPDTGLPIMVKKETAYDREVRRQRFHAALPAAIAASQSSVNLG